MLLFGMIFGTGPKGTIFDLPAAAYPALIYKQQSQYSYCLQELEETHRFKVRGLLERATSLARATIPVQMQQPAVQMWIVVSNHLHVAPKEGIVPNVEAHDGDEQTNVRLGQMLAKDEGTLALADDLLHPIQMLEECQTTLFVRFLRTREASLPYRQSSSNRTVQFSLTLYTPLLMFG